jgi:hypothetical protein
VDDELEQAMDWTADIVQAFCAQEELGGPLLHMFTDARDVNVVALAAQAPSEALAVARALIVVQQPALVTFVLETISAEIHLPRARADPLVRDWVERRLAGKEAPVGELPGDYVFELLLLVGEARDGARAQRAWRLCGPKGARSAVRYAPQGGLQLCGPVLLHPLFIADEAGRAGIDPAQLRRQAQLYLAHSQSFEKIYERPVGEEP